MAIPIEHRGNYEISLYPLGVAAQHNPRFSTCGGSALGAVQYPVGMAAGQLCTHIILWNSSVKYEQERRKERPAQAAGAQHLQELHPSEAIP